MLIIEALGALGALSRLRVIHTCQLGPSGPNHFSRAGLQTADAISLQNNYNFEEL